MSRDTYVAENFTKNNLSILQMMALYDKLSGSWNEHQAEIINTGEHAYKKCIGREWPNSSVTNSNWNFTQNKFTETLFAGILNEILIFNE